MAIEHFFEKSRSHQGIPTGNLCHASMVIFVGSLAKPNPNQLLVSQEVWWKCGLDCLKYLIPRKVPHNGCLLALFWGLKLCWLWFSYSIEWYFDLSVDYFLALWHFYHTIAQSHFWAPQWYKKRFSSPERSIRIDEAHLSKGQEGPSSAARLWLQGLPAEAAWKNGGSECDPPFFVTWIYMENMLKFHGWKIMVFTFKHHLSSSSCDGFKHGFTSFIIFFLKHDLPRFICISFVPCEKTVQEPSYFFPSTTWQVDEVDQVDHPWLSRRERR